MRITLISTTSLKPTKTAISTTDTITTIVDSDSSERVGHEHFFISARTSSMNVLAAVIPCCILLTGFLPSEKLAGQEGLEPTTTGFGDRCSAN